MTEAPDGRGEFEKRDFLGLPLAAISTRQFIDTVIGWAKAKRRARVTYINAMCVNQAADDSEYCNCLKSADFVYADGQAIVWAAKWLKEPVPERVNAGDFFVDFFKRCTSEEVKVYFLGSPEGVARRAASFICGKAPGVSIVGTHHGYMTDEITPGMIETINASGADLLIVGMGVPHQEKWLWANWEKLDVPVAWCIGATFDYFGGSFKRAPVWMRRIGLEWLFRLVLEPRRLWKRYLIGNPRFLLRVLRRKSLG